MSSRREALELLRKGAKPYTTTCQNKSHEFSCFYVKSVKHLLKLFQAAGVLVRNPGFKCRLSFALCRIWGNFSLACLGLFLCKQEGVFHLLWGTRAPHRGSPRDDTLPLRTEPFWPRGEGWPTLDRGGGGGTRARGHRSWSLLGGDMVRKGCWCQDTGAGAAPWPPSWPQRLYFLKYIF